jgi:hypothetical protein
MPWMLLIVCNANANFAYDNALDNGRDMADMGRMTCTKFCAVNPWIPLAARQFAVTY